MKTKTLIRVAEAALALLVGGSASPQRGFAAAEIPPVTEAPDKAQRVACVNNLKQLGLSLQTWAANNADLLPSNIFSMSNEVTSTMILVCPGDPCHVPANDWGSCTSTNLSYKFLSPSAKVAAPQEVVFLCPIHGNVTLMDGSVQSRLARTHPEQFVMQDGKLYLGEPVFPARPPNLMVVLSLDNPMTAPPTVTQGSGRRDIKMDERMMRRYGLLPPTTMSTPVHTNTPPTTGSNLENTMNAPRTVATSSGSPSIRMDERRMQDYGLLPLTAAQTPAGPEPQPQAGRASTGKVENADTESAVLKRNLRDQDPKVRRATIEKLARDLGEGAQVRLTPRKALLDQLEMTQNSCATLLAESLQDEDEQVRFWAASALYLCGRSAKVALPQLLELLQGTNQPLKSLAARTLGNLGTNAMAAVPVLENMLQTPPGEPRLVAAQVLWSITRHAPLVVPALIEALDIKTTSAAESWRSLSAARTLADIGPEAGAAIPALRRMLRAEVPMVRVAAAEALARISPDTPGLAEVLGGALQLDPSMNYLTALRSLCGLGSRSVPVLSRALSDPSPVMRRLAIETLGSIGTPAKEAVTALATRLRDPDELVRRAAAQALGKMASECKAAVPQLRAALQDTSNMVRATVAAALIKVDPPANEAVSCLVEAISDRRDMNAYITACNAAEAISPAAVPAILEFLKVAPPAGTLWSDQGRVCRTQAEAIALLGRMGSSANAAVPALMGTLENKRMPHRREVAEALGLIGPDAMASVPALKSALEDPDVWLRLNAAVALARIELQEQSNVLLLTQFLKAQDPSFRATAASALGEMGTRARSAIPTLRELARDDDDESVLREVTPALEAIEADSAKEARK
jgi:HEAT repeat protein